MSEHALPVTAEHLRYVAEHTVAEDAFLTGLRREAAEAGIPSIAIAPEQGSLIQILLRLAGVREVIEVGTLYGLASIWMARALPPDGHVHTIEVSGKHADFSEAAIARSDVAGRVTVHRGRGLDVLPKFKSASADAAFLDADKSNYPAYLEECLRIVRPGGLIMADNAFAFGQLLDADPTDREVEAVRAFNEIIAREKRLQSIIVPAGDGLWVCVRID